MTSKYKKGPPIGWSFFGENEMRDLNNLNATVRWTVACGGLDRRNTLIESNPSISAADAERREEIATPVCALVRNDISFMAASILFTRHKKGPPIGWSFFGENEMRDLNN